MQGRLNVIAASGFGLITTISWGLMFRDFASTTLGTMLGVFSLVVFGFPLYLTFKLDQNRHTKLKKEEK